MARRKRRRKAIYGSSKRCVRVRGYTRKKPRTKRVTTYARKRAPVRRRRNRRAPRRKR